MSGDILVASNLGRRASPTASPRYLDRPPPQMGSFRFPIRPPPMKRCHSLGGESHSGPPAAPQFEQRASRHCVPPAALQSEPRAAPHCVPPAAQQAAPRAALPRGQQ